MEINKIFNSKRFGKYLAADLRRCGANFGVSFIALTLAAVILTCRFLHTRKKVFSAR